MSTGIITTIAGSTEGYGYNTDSGVGTSVYLNYPQGLAVDASGSTFKY